MTPRPLLSITGMFALRLFALALVDRLHPGLARDYCQWDCGWYVDVVRNGYALEPQAVTSVTYGQANWAFFPLYPLLLGTVALLLQVSLYVAALLTANLFLFMFVILAMLYLPQRRPGANPVALAAFLLAFPYGLYFSLPYTESLFACLATAALLSLSARRLTATAGLGMLLSATRIPGILFTPIVVIRALTPAASAWRNGDRILACSCAADALLPIALAPLGLFLFMGYLYLHMGDGLAFAHIQLGWDRHAGSPFTTLLHGLAFHDWHLAFARSAQSGAVCEMAAIAGLVVSLRLLFLKLLPECWLLLGTILLAAASGLGSMQRFVFANPVFLIFLFDWLWQSAWARRCFVPLLAACALLQLYFARCWLEGYGFLM